MATGYLLYRRAARRCMCEGNWADCCSLPCGRRVRLPVPHSTAPSLLCAHFRMQTGYVEKAVAVSYMPHCLPSQYISNVLLCQPLAHHSPLPNSSSLCRCHLPCLLFRSPACWPSRLPVLRSCTTLRPRSPALLRYVHLTLKNRPSKCACIKDSITATSQAYLSC